MSFTHKELVEIGYKWLQNKCGFALKELSAFTRYGEIPDCIGFRSDCSILLEAKTSRADFKADAKKVFRVNSWQGMGAHRLFICETELIKPEELPDGWGLIYVNEKRKPRIIVKPWDGNAIYTNQFKEYNKLDERALMYSALRRLNVKNMLSNL